MSERYRLANSSKLLETRKTPRERFSDAVLRYERLFSQYPASNLMFGNLSPCFFYIVPFVRLEGIFLARSTSYSCFVSAILCQESIVSFGVTGERRERVGGRKGTQSKEHHSLEVEVKKSL